MLAVLLPPSPVCADTYELPDTIQVKDVQVVKNVAEAGDMFIAFWYEWSYASEDDIPAIPADQVILFTLLDTDGTTILATQKPYVFFENGFQQGISGFYFADGDDPTWGGAYKIRISAVPGIYTTPPDPVNYTLTSSDYSLVETEAENEAILEAWLIVAGCSAREATPPSDSAREKTLILLRNLLTDSIPPFSSNETTPPNPFICLLAISCPGWEPSPG